MKYCIICGTDKHSKKIAVNKKFGWDVKYCKLCSLGYAYEDDNKIKNAYKRYYQNEYWHSREGKKNVYGNIIGQLIRTSGLKIIRFFRIYPLMAISHHEIIKKYSEKKRLLEIGPGLGYTLRYFHSKGFQVKAIEPDKVNASRINKYFGKMICANGDSEKIRIKDKFDIIYMCHSLEHIVSPLAFLKKIRDNMEKDSIIFVEVPNCENKKMMHSSAVENETHVYHYTKKSLKSVFEKSGFTILHSDVYDDKTKNVLFSIIKSIFQIPNYKTENRKTGMKLVLVAKKA